MTTRTDELLVALAQQRVDRDPRANLAAVDGYAAQAAAVGARLLLLPEGIIARDPADEAYASDHAQPLDGPFVAGLAEISARHDLTLAATVHLVADGAADRQRPTNSLLVLRRGEVVARYDKLHLYDAFASRESDSVQPGVEVPALVEVDGWRLGLMTCYDVRFPELARALALAGADALLLPAAWVRGPLKEEHWRVMVTARALENTVYVLACGEAGERNIGRSMVVDPLGVTVADAGEVPGLLLARLGADRLDAARERLPVLSNRRFAPPTLASPDAVAVGAGGQQ